MIADDLIDGYYDGLRDDRTELPAQHNYSDLYVHGWLNGRDDRLEMPRKSATATRQDYEAIIEKGGHK